MKPLKLRVNSMQPAHADQPDGPVRLVLVSAEKAKDGEPARGQHIALVVYDRDIYGRTDAAARMPIIQRSNRE